MFRTGSKSKAGSVVHVIAVNRTLDCCAESVRRIARLDVRHVDRYATNRRLLVVQCQKHSMMIIHRRPNQVPYVLNVTLFRLPLPFPFSSHFSGLKFALRCPRKQSA